jgi:hypothetical protein
MARAAARFGAAPALASSASNRVDLPLPYGPTSATERGPAGSAFHADLVMRSPPFMRGFSTLEQTAGAIPLLPDLMIDPIHGRRKADSQYATMKDLPRRNSGDGIGKGAVRR